MPPPRPLYEACGIPYAEYGAKTGETGVIYTAPSKPVLERKKPTPLQDTQICGDKILGWEEAHTPKHSEFPGIWTQKGSYEGQWHSHNTRP